MTRIAQAQPLIKAWMMLRNQKLAKGGGNNREKNKLKNKISNKISKHNLSKLMKRSCNKEEIAFCKEKNKLMQNHWNLLNYRIHPLWLEQLKKSRNTWQQSRFPDSENTLKKWMRTQRSMRQKKHKRSKSSIPNWAILRSKERWIGGTILHSKNLICTLRSWTKTTCPKLTGNYTWRDVDKQLKRKSK